MECIICYRNIDYEWEDDLDSDIEEQGDLIQGNRQICCQQWICEECCEKSQPRIKCPYCRQFLDYIDAINKLTFYKHNKYKGGIFCDQELKEYIDLNYPDQYAFWIDQFDNKLQISKIQDDKPCC